MGSFFNLDSPLVKFGNLLADILILSFIWLIFSLPIFTIGASTTALFYVATRRISNREGYLFKDFFQSFKREFKKATIIFIFIAFCAFVISFNLYNLESIYGFLNLGNIFNFIYTSLQYCFLIELCFFTIFVFPLLARFDLPLKQLFYNAFFISNRHFLTSLVCLILFVGLIFFTVTFAIPFLFAVTTVYAFLSSYLIMRIFKKYRPEIDSDDLEIV